MLLSTLVSVIVSVGCQAALSVPGWMERGAPHQVAEPARAESEYFLWSRAGAVPFEEGEPIAVMALRCIDRRAEVGRGAAGPDQADFLIELETVFKAGGLRVRHTESGRGDARRLVWRETLPRSSRTWMAEWSVVRGAASARSIGYGWHRPIHEPVAIAGDASRPLYGPLEMLAQFRSDLPDFGSATGGFGMIDPRSASILNVERREVTSRTEVQLDVRRSDGSLLVGAVRSLHSERRGLSSIALSDRAGISRRIDRTEFERLERRWAVRSRRPYDAILAAIPRRR